MINVDQMHLNGRVPNLTAPYIFRLAEKVKKLDERVFDSISFNFSRMVSVEPFAMLLAGSVLRRFCSTFGGEITIDPDSINTYAGTMGFYQYAFPGCSEGKAPGEASGSNTYIPITKINLNDLREQYRKQGSYLPDGQMLENEAHNLATVFAGNNKELVTLFTYLLREMMRNTPEHSGSHEVWVCAQYWRRPDWAEIALLDEGMGIFESLTKNPHHRAYIEDEPTALIWATKAGISQALAPSSKDKGTDDWANSGFGLYMASQICKKLGGEFQLASKNHYLSITPNGTETKTTYSQGTAVRMRIRRSSLQIEAQKLISETVREGETEAKRMRAAFKRASKPSRSLMQYLNIPDSQN